MARTQEERKAETRARLVDAAADQFARKGFHAVSAEAVADAADRTTGALYAHFGGKEGLLLALLENWKAETVAEVETEITGGDIDAGLDALWERFVAPPGQRGDDWNLLEHELWLYAARNSEVAGAVATRFSDDRANFGRGIEHWDGLANPANGQTGAPFDTEARATLALGLLLGLAMQHRLDPSSVPDSLVNEGLRRVLGYPADPPKPARARTRRPAKTKVAG